MNSFGEIFRLTTFGESHSAAIGGIIDGVPAASPIDIDKVQQWLDRRKPGSSSISSARQESDRIEFLSGIYKGKSLGTPIGFIIRNNDARPEDYKIISETFRPSHADFTYEQKYSLRDPRGGGRASARETATRVAAGAIAMQILEQYGIKINSCTYSVGDISMSDDIESIDFKDTYSNPVRCPDEMTARLMKNLILDIKSEGDTIGGSVACMVSGVPAGLGDPVFGKLQSRLASAMMSIPAAKGFEYGMGFDACHLRGSECADIFFKSADNKIGTKTNYSGGIQGGISNGNDIYFRVGFKPAPTLMRDVESVDREGNRIIIPSRGRHDPCVVPRAVPVVAAMTALVILDLILLRRKDIC